MEEDSRTLNPIKIGVTISENDVFETEDLPEDDQQLVSDFISISSKENHKSDCIESSKIDASEAFKAFANKSLDSQYVDFSDSIATPKAGYPMTKVDVSKKETLEEKYSRLAKSIDHLEKELNIVNVDKEKSEGSTLSIPSMAQRLGFLQRELSSVEMKEHFEDKDPQKFYQRKLLNDLDLFISSPKYLTPASSTAATNDDAIKYQFYCDPGHMLHTQDAAIEDLEQRIEKCEDIVGLDSEFFSGDTPSKTLMGALSLVSAKFALLDLMQLTHFESSLLAIHQKQIQASTKSEASDIADKVDKVSHVYDTIKKTNPFMEKLPDLSKRLKTLEEVHQSATQLSCTLSSLDLNQKQLMERLQSHTEHLKQIQALLSPQMSLFDANCKALEGLHS